MIALKTTKLILITIFGIVLILINGCGTPSLNLPDGYISEYLPITLNDHITITSGTILFDSEELVRTDFDKPELLIIYESLRTLHPRDEMAEARFGVGLTLRAEGENHVTYLAFHGDFVYASIITQGEDEDVISWIYIDGERTPYLYGVLSFSIDESKFYALRRLIFPDI